MGFPARRRDRPSESQASPRAEWYDRNPAGRQQGFSGLGLSPHALTERWTYTVPTGKKFFVENAHCATHRKTAATAASDTYAFVSARGGSIVQSFVFTNTVGDKDKSTVGRNVVMVTGEVLDAYSYDGSTGGTTAQLLCAHGIEFDA